MLTSIPSLDSIVQCLLPAFTQPSFQTHIEVLLGWVMGLGKRTEYEVFQATQADAPASRKERHPFDRFYNFFSRSAWIVHDLAHQVAVAIIVALDPRGVLYLVVDDTLLHKRGKRVYCLPIHAPHHGRRESIQKLSPWVWLMQSLISLWYFTEGHKLPQARTARRRFGDWGHGMVAGLMLRAEILANTIRPKSATKADLYQLLGALENYLSLAT